MAYGDVGGAENWRSVSFVTPSSGTISIAKGDAVSLSGNFEVNNDFSAEDVIVGEALAAADENDQLLAAKVSGIAKFRYTGVVPTVDGAAGVLASATDGQVKTPASGNGVGRNLKQEETSQTLTLASVLADDSVTINGLTFTAHATVTTVADREFSISGDDTADAQALKGLINDAVYGVPGVTATGAAAVLTLTADDLDNTTVTVADAAATITAAVTGGNVWVLL